MMTLLSKCTARQLQVSADAQIVNRSVAFCRPTNMQVLRSSRTCLRRLGVKKVPVAALKSNSVAVEASPGLSELERVISEAQRAVQRDWPASNTIVQYTGEGVQLGVKVQWSVMLRADGAFVEECRSKELSSTVGFDGSLASNCWEVDGMGLPKTIELDDHEHCLMTNWVRAGFWARPEAQERLEISVMGPETLKREPEMSHIPESPASTSGAEDELICSQGHIQLQLKEGEVVGRLESVDQGWQPGRFQIQIFGKVDSHLFTDWRKLDGHWFPWKYRFQAAAGSENVFQVTSHKVVTAWQPTAFQLPSSLLKPPDTLFEPSGKGKMPGWWTSSGHIVVQPKINGQEIGYMILDTGLKVLDAFDNSAPIVMSHEPAAGASGFVIEAEAADQLGLSRFGSFHCSGMMDNVQICFRRAESISLGPLTIRNPLFMEMQLGGLVRGAPGQVIGIAGYDVFRRCVMEIPFPETRHGELEIEMMDPSDYEPPTSLEPFWHSLEFVSSLPLIKATIGAGGKAHDVRLMIDSGAGGVDLMFNKRATDNLGLLNEIPASTRLIKGVGGSLTEKQRVKSGLLPWMQISESRFEKLDCLFIGSAGLDLSHYVQGIICGELVARCRAVLDFARNRVALLPQEKSVSTSDLDSSLSAFQDS